MTQPNLYKPPDAPTAEFRPEGVQRSARPIAAWLLLVLMAFLTLALVAGIWRGIWMIALDWERVRAPWRVAGLATGEIAVVAAQVAVILAIFRGKPWARWIGLACIVAFSIWNLVREDHTVYPNDAQAAGASLGQHILFPVLSIWWAWAFAFTQKARRFFGGQPTDEA